VSGFVVQPADHLDQPSPADVAEVNEFENELWHESDPGEGDLGAATTAMHLRETWHGFEHHRWIARDADAGEIIGMVRTDVPVGGENEHLVELMNLGVRPAGRRRGVGRALLRAVVADGLARDRTCLGFWTTSRVAAGEVFAGRLGAQPGLIERESECELARVDRSLVEAWSRPGDSVTADYELWRCVGPYPPATYAAIADAQNIMNTAPRDNLDRNDIVFTAEHVASGEATRDFDLCTRWAHFIRHRSSGRLVGLTRVYIWRDWVGMVEQGDTAVHPDHRGRGLGKWLKGSMVRHLLDERPDASRIRTSNAYSNGPMVAINEALGFRVTREITHWQVGMAQAGAALGIT